LKAAIEEEIASGQWYESKDGCMRGVKSVKKNAPKAKIVDMTAQNSCLPEVRSIFIVAFLLELFFGQC